MKHEITDLGLLAYGLGMAALGYLWRAFMAAMPEEARRRRRRR